MSTKLSIDVTAPRISSRGKGFRNSTLHSKKQKEIKIIPVIKKYHLVSYSCVDKEAKNQHLEWVTENNNDIDYIMTYKSQDGLCHCKVCLNLHLNQRKSLKPHPNYDHVLFSIIDTQWRKVDQNTKDHDMINSTFMVDRERQAINARKSICAEEGHWIYNIDSDEPDLCQRCGVQIQNNDKCLDEYGNIINTISSDNDKETINNFEGSINTIPYLDAPKRIITSNLEPLNPQIDFVETTERVSFEHLEECDLCKQKVSDYSVFNEIYLCSTCKETY